MTTAFLFPGQGSQRVGMAGDLKAVRPDIFERYFGVADTRSGLPLARLCIEGSIEQLTPTEVAQPAIFTLSVALIDLAREAGIEPALAAGHSLGEFAALVAAGVLEWEECFDLVCLRGRLMAAAQQDAPGAMGAIGGLTEEVVERICSEAAGRGVVVIANHNSPEQCVVSGHEAAVDQVVEAAKKLGASPALRLKVGAAFHSPLMDSVRAPLAVAFGGAKWHDARFPLASNATGTLLTRGDQIREQLVAQVTSRVRWLDCMRTLIGAGASTFLELGPGRVLVGQARLIDHDLDAFAADGPKKLETFVASHPRVAQC